MYFIPGPCTQIPVTPLKALKKSNTQNPFILNDSIFKTPKLTKT